MYRCHSALPETSALVGFSSRKSHVGGAAQGYNTDWCSSLFRAKRRRKGGASTEKLPVFATRSTTRGQSRPRGATATRQRASTASLASAVPFTQSPASISSESALVTTGLSARRNQQSRNWGKAKAQQQVEHTWNGIATQTRTTSLKPKEELDLTTRLKKYFKLKDRYDALSEELGYTPGMDEFARRLGTDKVSAISTIMTDGPKQKAAMVRHNMGLVVNIISKYDHPDVTREVRDILTDLLQKMQFQRIAVS